MRNSPPDPEAIINDTLREGGPHPGGKDSALAAILGQSKDREVPRVSFRDVGRRADTTGRRILSSKGKLVRGCPHNESCNNYSVISTRQCLFNHTSPPALSMTYNPALRDNGHQIAPGPLIICTGVYVHYNLHKMFHVEHCTYTSPAQKKCPGFLRISGT
jgi:hypothetical protein